MNALTIASRSALTALLQDPAHVRAVAMVRNERAHQVDLAFDPAHDSQHCGQELAYASLAYLWEYVDPGGKPAGRAWPWSAAEVRFRPRQDPAYNLVAALALGLAELERLLRECPAEPIVIVAAAIEGRSSLKVPPLSACSACDGTGKRGEQGFPCDQCFPMVQSAAPAA